MSVASMFGQRSELGRHTSLDPVEHLRLKEVLPHARGRLLDLGCGYNNLVRQYGQLGVGVDVFPWPGTDILVGDSSRLPFGDAVFDTVCVLAALNHIPNRAVVLYELARVMAPDGQLILTMINPIVGEFVHIFFRRDEDVRGFQPGEQKGMWMTQVVSLLQAAGLGVAATWTFELGLNRVYIATKQASTRTVV